jgi:hypothetical protein
VPFRIIDTRRVQSAERLSEDCVCQGSIRDSTFNIDIDTIVGSVFLNFV